MVAIELQLASSASPDGTAVEYKKQVGTTPSVEMHTTLSAHPILLQLAPGRYRVRAERGKEYIPAEREIIVSPAPSEFQLVLRRFIDMQAAGWYSGARGRGASSSRWRVGGSSEPFARATRCA